MWLGSAVRDFSPAYPPTCAVEELSWEAPLRSWGFVANSFPMGSLQRFFWEWQRLHLNDFLRFRESVSPQKAALQHTAKRFSPTPFMCNNLLAFFWRFE